MLERSLLQTEERLQREYRNPSGAMILASFGNSFSRLAGRHHLLLDCKEIINNHLK